MSITITDEQIGVLREIGERGHAPLLQFFGFTGEGGIAVELSWTASDHGYERVVGDSIDAVLSEAAFKILTGS